VFVTRLSDGKTDQLTHDGESSFPVWGGEWIAYGRTRFGVDEKPFWELRLIRPDGSGDRLFARDERTAERYYGLIPLEFSDDGKRLLACTYERYGCRPVTFEVPEGKRRELSVRDDGAGITARELARDGSEVLVEVGPLEGPANVYAIPFEGGTARLLAKDASSPSWAR
jgi:hypothetical protein